MSRNAEVVFWSNLPLPWLAAAALPHAGFLLAQLAWRLARGRARPFLLGKLDALRQWQLLLARRRLHTRLARDTIAAPHFPLNFGLLGDVRNHMRRPGEASSKSAH
jgi:hypothetical protein